MSSNMPKIVNHVILTPTTTSKYTVTQSIAKNTNSESDREEFLEEQNLTFLTIIAPTIAYLVMVSVAGVVGNTISLMIYYRRFNPSPIRLYVLAIIGCDLLTNTLTLPTKIPFYRFQYTFYCERLCKLSWIVNSFLICLKGSFLLAVPLDLQPTLCPGSPRDASVSVGRGKVSIALGLLTSLVLALPGVYFIKNSAVQVEAEGRRETGWTCSVIKPKRTMAHSVFFGALFIFISIAALVMLASYCRIALHLRQHKKRSVIAASTTTAATIGTTANSGAEAGTSCDRISGAPTASKGAEDEGAGRRGPLGAPPGQPPSAQDIQAALLQAKAQPRPHKRLRPQHLQTSSSPQHQAVGNKGKEIRGVRATLMVFLLTLVYILSFVPYLAVTLTRENKSTLSVQGLEPNVAYIMFNSYYLNSTLNPVIFTFCSAKFRLELRRLFEWR